MPKINISYLYYLNNSYLFLSQINYQINISVAWERQIHPESIVSVVMTNQEGQPRTANLLSSQDNNRPNKKDKEDLFKLFVCNITKVMCAVWDIWWRWQNSNADSKALAGMDLVPMCKKTVNVTELLLPQQQNGGCIIKQGINKQVLRCVGQFMHCNSSFTGHPSVWGTLVYFALLLSNLMLQWL